MIPRSLLWDGASAVDGELKPLNHNPMIGLLLYKGKGKIVAEYALKDVKNNGCK